MNKNCGLNSFGNCVQNSLISSPFCEESQAKRCIKNKKYKDFIDQHRLEVFFSKSILEKLNALHSFNRKHINNIFDIRLLKKFTSLHTKLQEIILNSYDDYVNNRMKSCL